MQKRTMVLGLVLFVWGAYMSTRPSLNVRNNNPLNIRFSERNNWDGQTGQNSGFAEFSTPEYGFRAAYKLVKRYMEVDGLTSVPEIISKWAPSSENHTQAYVDYVLDGMNKWGWTSVSGTEVRELLFHMAEFEGAKGAFNYDQIDAGIALA